MVKWIETGSVALGSLTEARVQLHYAALILGSTADSILEAADDDGHTNLGFNPATTSLETRPLEKSSGISLRLELPTLTLTVSSKNETVDRFALSGQTLTRTLDWLRDCLLRNAGVSHPIKLREYPDFPHGPLADGGAFGQPPRAELTELAVWLGNGVSLLTHLRATHPKVSPMRVWPHHLDLGSLIRLEVESDRMIGLGLSLGDGYYDQPYFYCTPYPNPPADQVRPRLHVGHWHTQDFVSAIATADELRSGQGEAAERYLADAVAAGITLVA